jgi:hypothetical protein
MTFNYSAVDIGGHCASVHNIALELGNDGARHGVTNVGNGSVCSSWQG